MELIENKKTPTLCLNMIVKNESRIIQRLFDSVLPIIDCYCICDTGSTDNTVQLIIDYFNSKNITGKVVSEPFKNFCYNRNFALQSCLGMSDYVLLMDADMKLEINTFNKNLLNLYDSFFIVQGNPGFYYQNMRIVKNNGLYKYLGVTHEYLDVPNDNTTISIEKEQLFILDIGDGGSKNNKFERDIMLLLDGIKEEPDNARYYFYLANSYHDTGRFGEAIELYNRRIQFGGWKEEVWYSYYRIGLCYKNLNKMENAIFSWINGYEFYPERLEGLYEIIRHYRISFKPKLGLLFYKEAKRQLLLNNNLESCLFLHKNIYLSKIYYEYTVFALYAGVTNINYEIVKVLNNSTDDSETNNMLSNMKFYKYILTQKSKIILDKSELININNVNRDFISSSSCLIPNKNKNGYIMNNRYVNYYINDGGGYLNCDDHIISYNKYIELDNNFNITNDKWFKTEFIDKRYIGIEDIRIFNDVETNKMLFIGTGLHNDNIIGIVSGCYDTDNMVLNHCEIKQDFNNTGCEKNWVFIDYNNSTHIIYSWYPLLICKINTNTNKLDIVKSINTPKFFSKFRGSTCGFKYSKKVDDNRNGNISISIIEDEIWFITHIVSYENPRHYYHIIVVFDSNMNLLRYSAPFKFEGDPIEYCLGLVVEDNRVIINYSTWDRSTRLGIYDKKYIDSIVKYI